MSELPVLQAYLVPWCYLLKNASTISAQVHGFSVASEVAHASMVHLWTTEANSHVHLSLVIAKTKVPQLHIRST